MHVIFGQAITASAPPPRPLAHAIGEERGQVDFPFADAAASSAKVGQRASSTSGCRHHRGWPSRTGSISPNKVSPGMADGNLYLAVDRFDLARASSRRSVAAASSVTRTPGAPRASS
jgi:hypothetical protein